MNHVKRALHRHRVALLTGSIGLSALVLTWALVLTEIRSERLPVNWPAFAIIALLLLWCERTPATWIRFGSAGVVTPLGMFAFGLMLVGSPSFAVGVALVGATLSAVTQSSSPVRIVMRVAGAAVALSAAGLIMMGMGVHGSITQFGYLPWNWALAIVAASVTIVVLNTSVAAVSMSIRRRTSFLGLMQRSLAVRITAEGALLSLAPIWVIGIDFGLVLAPLLGITTVLVFRSTRQALERSHEAHHDSLTGLVNRRSFLESLEEMLDEAHPSARPTMLIMDLDGFKDINDRLGHQLGDALLISFADRLEQSVPPEAVAARFGGDEFAVLLVDEHAEQVIDELGDALSEPLMVEDFPVTIRVSIGVAQAPDDGLTSRDLLRAADVAMYKAKRTGAPVVYYESCVQGPQRGRLNLLGDLGEALENHELSIHFQPQLRLSDGEVDTVEALIRWQHPEHGSIPPDEFIGLAEQTDLIVPITELVLRIATQGLLNSGVTAHLAVNVSPRNLQDPEFADQVFAILQESGFRADRLELEVTERSIVSNAERCRYTIEQLRRRGVRVAIDDFGVGYSSFEALRVLDVDRVKIDRHFVKGIIDQPRDRLIVASVIDLAHDLGLDVVAEGVENVELWHALAELNCDVAQGYGIAAPMAYPALRGWLSSWSEVQVARLRGPAPDSDAVPTPSEQGARPTIAAAGS
ncbi:putative bifunctional diguanylate cyclase/phosphodiesterase [Ilumatobacter sp.]|uniref:putative bifunctional diguanylate cyclase/phosphodiesterase n=1 Tax=Ilumatobacter sp. TaxID=1967498 RepID=UPI003AF4DEAD